MDNLSHSVSGLAAGELIHRFLPREAHPAHQHVRRRLLLFSAWAANNVPDLDIVLAPLLPAPLGYLLHHRGHTHTLLYAIAQALLLMTIIWLAWPSARRLVRHSRSARNGAILAIGLGFVLHLLMDYLNSYGIHPFHPFDSRWLYGDMIFIIEPLFWVAFGVPMAMMVPRRALRIALLALLAGAPLFFTLRGFLSWGSFGALLAAGLLLGAFQHHGGSARRVLVGAFCLGAAYVGLQGYASGQGKRVVAEALHRSDPGSRLLDAALSSFPANPVCWSFVSVERKNAVGSYTLRRGVVSLAPGLVPVARCPFAFSGHPFRPGATAAIGVLAEHHGTLASLRALRSSNCHVDAWLRFARAPWLGETEAWDLRFGEQAQGNFSTIRYADFARQPCPRGVPAWGYPRSDLLSPKGQ